MAIQAHINVLETKLADINEKIRLAYLNHLPEEELHQLKKDRLHIEEEISKCQQDAANAA